MRRTLAHRAEVEALIFTGNMHACILAPFFASFKLCIFVTFVFYILHYGRISAEQVFVSVAIYMSIRLVLHLYIPLAITHLSESKTTLKRIKVTHDARRYVRTALPAPSTR